MIQKKRMKTKEIPKELIKYSLEDVMEWLEISSKTTIFKRMDIEKTLPYRKSGKERFFLREDIVQYFKNCKVKTSKS